MSLSYAELLRTARLAARPSTAEVDRRAARERQRPIEGISIAELAARLAAHIGDPPPPSGQGLAAQVSEYESARKTPGWDRAVLLLQLCETHVRVGPTALDIASEKSMRPQK